MRAESLQLCLTLCNPLDCSPSGFTFHGIFLSRILEGVAISYSRKSSRPRDWTCVSWASCQMSSGSQIAPVENPAVSSSRAVATFSFPLWFSVPRTCLALWTRQNFAWRDEKRLCVREVLDFDFEEWRGIICVSTLLHNFLWSWSYSIYFKIQ